MIKSFAWLLDAANSRRVEALSRQVAELSLESVCQLVADRVKSMTFAEARGYVRARASLIVRKHARLAINRHPGANPAWLDDVAQGATERILPLVLRQTGVGVPQLAPTQRMAA